LQHRIIIAAFAFFFNNFSADKAFTLSAEKFFGKEVAV